MWPLYAPPYTYIHVRCFNIIWTNFNIRLGTVKYTIFILQWVGRKYLVKELRRHEVLKLVSLNEYSNSYTGVAFPIDTFLFSIPCKKCIKHFRSTRCRIKSIHFNALNLMLKFIQIILKCPVCYHYYIH